MTFVILHMGLKLIQLLFAHYFSFDLEVDKGIYRYEISYVLNVNDPNVNAFVSLMGSFINLSVLH